MYVRVEVTPGGKKEKVERIDEKTFNVTVREKAERNLANNRVRKIMSQVFGVPLGDVRIISGHRSPRKIINVEIQL